MVLLIPGVGICLLIVAGIRQICRWRDKAKGFDVTASVIEKLDDGPRSLGQKVKDYIGDYDDGIVGKALKSLEALWDKGVDPLDTLQGKK